MKAPQTHIETYILHYQHKSVHRYFRLIDECIEYVFKKYEQTGNEPQTITLPGRNTITYKGRANKRQLIDKLTASWKLKSFGPAHETILFRMILNNKKWKTT